MQNKRSALSREAKQNGSFGKCLLLFIAFFILHPISVSAAELKVAVASNFTKAFNTLSEQFERDSGHTLLASFGSSGKLYAQIVNGAPFDLMLSADAYRPQKLIETGLGIEGTRFTYASGRLVLCASDTYTQIDQRSLEKGEFQYLSIANPQNAPYGKAAMEVLTHLALLPQIKTKLVRGDNIAQTLHFVHSGAANLGFVALSQILSLQERGIKTAYWEVPEKLYSPIEQQLVLLQQGKSNPAAIAFMNFLKSQRSREIIEHLGYEVPRPKLNTKQTLISQHDPERLEGVN